MLQLGLDFIDIDWEYPVEGGNDQPPDDMTNFVALLAAIRDEFKNVPFAAELSVASPAGSPIYRHWDFAAICSQLDHINIMTYDLARSWSDYTDHQANLYEDKNHPKGLVYSVDGAIQDYIKGGCPARSKTPMPTRGSWVAGSGDGAGIWDYMAIPLIGATEFYDEKLGAAYSNDPNAKLFTSYDSPKSLGMKLDYIKKYNLGGTMFWSGDADAPTTSARSFIGQVYNYFGKDSMAFYENHLDYPTSNYDNIRNGGSTPTAPPSTSPPNTVPTTSNPATSSPVTTAPSTAIPITTIPRTASPTNSPSTDAPSSPVPTSSSPSSPPTSVPTSATTYVPTNAPTTSVPEDKCDGKSGGLCFWPFNKQVLPFGQSDCVKFSEFVWCP